ncbi:hypothetical protein [Sulfoacidibacillus thermotolerans]|uniref:DUF2642 domain-containing protein n=1 Tax=Sulfoacidibacillus thermotolerans TaxID=1765684 RepID=A0A2U3D859_SULT2|nr:hypothetical protein [Sulfoacidibacillus thermotolerans]PWI57463.1 hypothetical protein BM613_08285 [Sulfoacidibacillus thermotolerans]
MTFQSILTSFVGRTVEVVVPGSMYEGTLISVQNSVIQVEEPPVVYGQFVTVTIPTTSIDYVRIL